MQQFYQVTQWKEGYYRITSAEDVFCELITGTDSALLLDTGYAFGDLADTVKSITDLPLTVVNSHGHMDHCCGNYQFEQPIYIHPADIPLCREHNSEKTRTRAVELAKEMLDYTTGQKRNILPPGFDETAYAKAGWGNLTPLEEGQIFDLGGKQLEVVSLPGHTAGSIGLLQRSDEILFVGDAMNAHVWLFSPEALKLSDYIATLHKAENIPFSLMVQAHNPVVETKEILKVYLDMAENLNMEKGVPFSTPLVPGRPAVLCLRDGFSPMDFGKPGFASIVISEEHLG